MEVSKKKVLIAITKANWGGAQKYVYDLALNLNKGVFDISVIIGGEGELKDKLISKGIRVISLKSLGRDVNFFKDIKSFFDLSSILREERPDILHLNSSKMALGTLAGRICGVPEIIFTVHGWAFNENRSFISKLIIKALYFITILFSNHIIAVSEMIRGQIKYWPISKKKIIMIHNGVQIIDFKTREIARTEIESMVGRKIIPKFWFGSIGELHHIKGHRYAIQAIAKLGKDFGYFIIGEGELRRELSLLIKDLGLEDRVFLLGRIADASRYLKAFDIFIHPSLSEGLPFAVVEAGMAEIPVIASKVGGIPEIITGDNGLLFAPKDEVAIENSIRQIINNQSIREIYTNNLKKRIDSEFNIRKMIGETEKVYLIPRNS